MWKDFVSLFVSQSCYGCGNELISQERYICLKCLSQIPDTTFYQNFNQNELYFRFAGKVPVSGAASLFYFDKRGRLQSILKKLKYERAPHIGYFLGEYYGELLSETAFVSGLNAIIPVPLHKSKMISRGYNQSEMIARGLSKSLSIPINTRLLKRSRKTAVQARERGVERWRNVANAFKLTGNLPDNILLVDDVITTGSTMEACIRACLQANDAIQIKVASIAMTRKD